MQTNIKSGNSLVINSINFLPDNKIKIFLMNIQIKRTIDHILTEIKPNFLCNSIRWILLREEGEHEMTSIAEINKSELHFVMVVMIEYEIIDFLTTIISK